MVEVEQDRVAQVSVLPHRPGPPPAKDDEHARARDDRALRVLPSRRRPPRQRHRLAAPHARSSVEDGERVGEAAGAAAAEEEDVRAQRRRGVAALQRSRWRLVGQAHTRPDELGTRAAQVEEPHVAQLLAALVRLHVGRVGAATTDEEPPAHNRAAVAEARAWLRVRPERHRVPRARCHVVRLERRDAPSVGLVVVTAEDPELVLVGGVRGAAGVRRRVVGTRAAIHAALFSPGAGGAAVAAAGHAAEHEQLHALGLRPEPAAAASRLHRRYCDTVGRARRTAVNLTWSGSRSVEYHHACPVVVAAGCAVGGSVLATPEHMQVARDAVHVGPSAIDCEASTKGGEGECARRGALPGAWARVVLAGAPPVPARRAQLQPPVRDLEAPRPGDRGCEGEVGIAKLGRIVLGPERRCRSERIAECTAGGCHACGLGARQLEQDGVQHVTVVREELASRNFRLHVVLFRTASVPIVLPFFYFDIESAAGDRREVAGSKSLPDPCQGHASTPPRPAISNPTSFLPLALLAPLLSSNSRHSYVHPHQRRSATDGALLHLGRASTASAPVAAWSRDVRLG
eukprot:scaffold95066_cov63-Phaeocystis_antarctica.AAC.4